MSSLPLVSFFSPCAIFARPKKREADRVRSAGTIGTQEVPPADFLAIDLPVLLVLGVEKLVRHLHRHNIPVAVATGSGRQGYDAKITNHKEIFQLVSHTVTSDDPNLQRCKPAPDIFQLAASRFPSPPTSPGHVLVFEDAPNGVTAARAAGMKVVMVPDQRVDMEKCLQAHLVLNSLEEFDPTVWGFPPFDSNF